MSNLSIYDDAFIETFLVDKKDLPGLKYQSVTEWDSVGHMSLMTLFEESFEIELDTDDIINFSSYEAGKEILSKYGVKF